MAPFTTLRWRHNDHAGVSNHQPHGCLLNRLFRRKSKKTSKLRVTGLCAGNSPGTGEFPAQMASYAENVSIWWRHHEHGSTLIPAWISNYMPRKVWYEITYPFLNFNGGSGHCQIIRRHEIVYVMDRLLLFWGWNLVTCTIAIFRNCINAHTMESPYSTVCYNMVSRTMRGVIYRSGLISQRTLHTSCVSYGVTFMSIMKNIAMVDRGSVVHNYVCLQKFGALMIKMRPGFPSCATHIEIRRKTKYTHLDLNFSDWWQL